MDLEHDILGSGSSLCKGPEAGRSMQSRRTAVGRSRSGRGRGRDILSERGLGDVQGLEGLSPRGLCFYSECDGSQGRILSREGTGFDSGFQSPCGRCAAN